MKKFFNYFVKLILILGVFGLIALFISNSNKYINTTKQGLVIWASVVVPSLLPFFFLTNLITSTNIFTSVIIKLGKISQFLYKSPPISLFIRVMSILSGYPVGAKLISDLVNNKIISPLDGEKYSTFTSTSGPLFIIGAVGVGMLGNLKLGIIIFISHILSSYICSLFFRKMGNNGHIAPLLPKNKCDNILYNANYQAIISLLIVGGFIAIFYTLSYMIMDLNLLFPIKALLTSFMPQNLVDGILFGLIECTNGCKMLSTNNSPISISLICGIISFGGLSVWVQSIAFLKKVGVRCRFFAISKVLHTIFSIVICYCLVIAV